MNESPEKEAEMKSNEDKDVKKDKIADEKNGNEIKFLETKSLTIKSSSDQIEPEDLNFLDEDPTSEDGRILKIKPF